MNRLALSKAAAALFRSLLNRIGENRDRILLTEYRSTDWQSLTFVGERHQFAFRIVGDDANAILERLCANLGEDEFAIPGHVLADIGVEGRAERLSDGSIALALEALTIEE